MAECFKRIVYPFNIQPLCILIELYPVKKKKEKSDGDPTVITSKLSVLLAAKFWR